MRTEKDCVKLARYISGFLNEYAPTHKTQSRCTLKSYHDTLSLYIGFLETEKNIDSAGLCKTCFERPVIESWLAWLKTGRGCCPDTCNVRLAGLREFLKYVGSRDAGLLYLYLEAKEIPKMPTMKKKVNGLSREAVMALAEAPDTGTRMGKRDLTVIVLMYDTAVRLDELLSLKTKNLHLKATPCITVAGKGGKIRTVPILPRTVEHLRKYMDEFHDSSPASEAYVFYSRNNGIYGKLSQAAIDKMLKKHACQAHNSCPDVPLRLHAHQIRHARATHWLEDGMNIIQISHLLGHAQVETTMVYLDISVEQTTAALATLETEEDKKVLPKWKKADGSLAGFCGCHTMKR